MTVLRSILLFTLAALAEIGRAWLVWQGVREHRGLVFVGAGIVALGLYGFVATFQPDPQFGRILAAYGGVFVAGSLAWGMLVDGFRPDRYDLVGATPLVLTRRRQAQQQPADIGSGELVGAVVPARCRSRVWLARGGRATPRASITLPRRRRCWTGARRS
jgi:small multidrug resistance family-3 protein